MMKNQLDHFKILGYGSGIYLSKSLSMISLNKLFMWDMSYRRTCLTGAHVLQEGHVLYEGMSYWRTCLTGWQEDIFYWRTCLTIGHTLLEDNDLQEDKSYSGTMVVPRACYD